MTTTKYILDGQTPVPVDTLTWAKWYETAYRRVARDEIGPYQISTVFLGYEPNLFETMVFKGDFSDLWCEHSSTWEKAEAAHKRGCEYVKNELLSRKDENAPRSP